MAEATPTKTVKMELKRHYVPHKDFSRWWLEQDQNQPFRTRRGRV